MSRASLCNIWILLALVLPPALVAQMPPVQPTGGSRTGPKISMYVPGLTLSFVGLVMLPPAPGTAAQQADLLAVHRAESSRSASEVAAAQRDDHDETMFAFATIFGSRFRSENLPLTTALSVHLRAESSVINPALKLAFHRPRPFVADRTLHPVCDLAATNSYPSGHAMVGYLEGFALAQMIPEQSDAILVRAQELAQHRVVCGVHYPTDVEASRTLALALFGAISASPRFQQELAASRAELRKRLALP